MKRTLAALVGLLVVAGSLLVTAPAGSASSPWRGVITFDKNWQSPSNSRLVWQLSQRQGNGSWKVVQTKSWRSGSGKLGKRGRNSCVNNMGWLPNGTYAVKQYNDYPGHLIKGRAFRLEDKRCATGNRRFDLFIHTEQGARNRQCANRRGDQLCRWEFPRFNDYKSAGCIKLAPGDLAQLVALYQRHFAANARYPKSQVVLRVIN
ncbi:MAG: hypothetical protein JWR85_1845 [Marmoricola sp.]|nr:hypothetical protein [Marmoricola sp.]